MSIFRWPLWLLLIACVFLARAAEDADVQVDSDDADDDSTGAKAAEETKPQKEQYKPPTIPHGSFLAESFDGADVFSRWQKSKAKKSGGDRYDGLWGADSHETSALHGDVGLIVKSKAKHHAIAAKFSSPFDFTSSKQLVVQYEVKFTNGMDCGGAYMKLLSHPLGSPDEFYDKTPYTIMFGPDKCGNDQKFHFIIRFRNPRSGKFEEKHMKRPDGFDLNKLVTDKKTHLFTLIITAADSSFELLVDQKRIKFGSLLSVDDFDPPIIPPAEIDDPKDKKPKDWDDRPKIADPESKKPDDWDESEPEFIIDKTAKKPSDWLENEQKMIPDPSATKPDDWEDDMDGEWEAPLIDNVKCASVSGCGKWEPTKTKNPKYKGKWSAPMIENPAFKGEWKPKKIVNPEYFEEKDPYSKLTSIDGVGFELWTMTDGIIFDNLLIADSRQAAEQWTKETWSVKHKIEDASSKSVFGALSDALSERPWLWIVVIIVIALPCALVIAYCCFSGGSSADEYNAADAARRKKTDAPSANDGAHGEEDLQEEGELEEDGDDDEMPPLEAQDEGDDGSGDDAVRHRVTSSEKPK